MQYRKAKPEDASGIGLVLKESYNIDSVKEGEAVFSSEISKGHQYIVAVDDSGKTVGIATWLSHGLPKHGLFELDRIAILPKFRGKGIAKDLFAALIADAQRWYRARRAKARKLYILTHAENKRAQEFYKKMGCLHEAILPKHYYDNTDEYVFSLFLDIMN